MGSSGDGLCYPRCKKPGILGPQLGVLMGSWLTARCAAVCVASICGTLPGPSQVVAQTMPVAGSATDEGGKKLTPEQHTHPCGLTDSPEVADLCEQRRMAEAAIRQVRWVKAQFWATIGEIALLLAAVGASIYAGWQARNAVIIANVSTAIAQDTAKRELRAYVGIDALEVESSNLTSQNYVPTTIQAGTRATDLLLVTMKNSGQTPAQKVRVWAGWRSVRYGTFLAQGHDFQADIDGSMAQVANQRLLVASERSLFPQQYYTTQVLIADLTPFRQAVQSAANLYVFGRIDYEDIFGEARMTKFCFIYEPWRPADNQFAPNHEFNEAT